MTSEIEEKLTSIAVKIVKQGKGCLIIIMENQIEYELMFGADISVFNLSGNERRIELLAIQDGAIIFSPKGNLIAYGARILNTRTFPNFGTKHSAGYTASLNGNLVILGSEEDKKVKLFKSGKVLMQIDTLEKGVEKSIPKAIDFLEVAGAGSLTAIGVSVFAPQMGISIIPGIIIFGSIYYLSQKLKYLFKLI